jgi:sugar lactone lactonase YvrE
MKSAFVASREVFRLGEGPVWDSARDRLLWVDIVEDAVYEGVLHGMAVEVIRRHDCGSMAGSVTVAEDGTLLVAAQERLILIRTDGTRVQGPSIVPTGERRRCNDGSTDPSGRFVVGTMSLTSKRTDREVLVRLEHDKGLTQLDTDLTLSNGLAWSVDGSRMYSVDTLRRVVHMRDYVPSTGAVGERHTFVQLVEGHPDGCATDAADHLWLAVWGEGEVHRYAPNGSLVERITLPVPNTTSVTFAGHDLSLLVVTTASDGLSEKQLRAFPDSGRLFILRPGVRGNPVTPWAPVAFS